MADKSFDKFTERARKVLNLAQEEAHRFGHNYIGTEHLLLGLVREGEGVAARVLARLGIGLDKVYSAVEFIIGRGEQMVTGDIGLTPRAKKVIELAIDEARKLNHHYIGTEHLLLGLVREGEGIAAGVLESMGVSLERVRAEVMNVLNSSGNASPVYPNPDQYNYDRFNEDARQTLDRAEQEAIRLGHNYVGAEHILLGLVTESDSPTAKILAGLGVELAKVHTAVEDVIGKNEQGDRLALDFIGLSPRAKRVIELANAESAMLHHDSTGSEHLLLAILREGEESRRPNSVIVRTTRKLFTGAVPEGEGIAYGVLRSFRLNYARVRPAVEDQLAKPAAQQWQEVVASDNFSEQARHVVELADEEARRFNHNYIGTEHILLGLIREGNNVANRVLRNLDVELHKVRSAIEFIIGRGQMPVSVEIGLTPRSRKVVELALDEARRLDAAQVGPEHLLLGLVREGEGIAAGVLESLGVSLGKVRAEVIKTLRDGGSAATSDSRTSTVTSKVVASALRALWVRIPVDEQLRPLVSLACGVAEKINHFDVGTEHLLLALLRDDSSLAAHAMNNLGITLHDAYIQLKQLRGEGNPDLPTSGISPRFGRVIDTQAKAKAKELGHENIGSEHVLLALLDETDSLAATILRNLGVTLEQVRDEVMKLIEENKANE